MAAVSYEQDLEFHLRIADENNAVAFLRNRVSRRARLIELRTAIQQGSYQVSAGDLADALLRSARSID